MPTATLDDVELSAEQKADLKEWRVLQALLNETTIERIAKLYGAVTAAYPDLARKTLKEASEREMTLRVKLATVLNAEIEGTRGIRIGDEWRGKAVKKCSYKLTNAHGETQQALAQVGHTYGAYAVEELIRWEPVLSVSAYRKLPEAGQIMFNDALTVKPASPTIEFQAPPSIEECLGLPAFAHNGGWTR